MGIKVGDSIPEATMNIMGDKGPQEITTADIFAGKKVVLFAVPGAFTPTCSNQQLPGYEKQADVFKDHNIDEIYCVSVNDSFVMNAWALDLSLIHI